MADNGSPAEIMREVASAPGAGTLLQRLALAENRFKGSVWEPGVRVPLIVAGPGVTGGRASGVLVDGVDLFATVLELVGLEAADLVPADHRLDGTSLLPVLASPDGAHARTSSLVERFEPNGNPETIAYERGGMERHRRRHTGFVLETDAGRFKLVRNLDHLNPPGDLVFRLADADGSEVDPWELEPLPHDEAAPEENRAAHRALTEALERLVRSEPQNFP
jgi:arylsulfatase A-like enzyme